MNKTYSKHKFTFLKRVIARKDRELEEYRAITSGTIPPRQQTKKFSDQTFEDEMMASAVFVHEDMRLLSAPNTYGVTSNLYAQARTAICPL